MSLPPAGLADSGLRWPTAPQPPQPTRFCNGKESKKMGSNRGIRGGSGGLRGPVGGRSADVNANKCRRLEGAVGGLAQATRDSYPFSFSVRPVTPVASHHAFHWCPVRHSPLSSLLGKGSRHAHLSPTSAGWPLGTACLSRHTPGTNRWALPATTRANCQCV